MPNISIKIFRDTDFTLSAPFLSCENWVDCFHPGKTEGCDRLDWLNHTLSSTALCRGCGIHSCIHRSPGRTSSVHTTSPISTSSSSVWHFPFVSQEWPWVSPARRSWPCVVHAWWQHDMRTACATRGDICWRSSRRCILDDCYLRLVYIICMSVCVVTLDKSSKDQLAQANTW